MHPSQLSAGFAGAIAIAGGTLAYGMPVVRPTPADVATPAPGTNIAAVTWDADGDTIADFTFQFRFPNATGTGVRWQAKINPFPGNAVAGFHGPFINYASNFGDLTLIGPTLPHGSSFRTATQVTLGSVYVSGGVALAYGGFGNGAPTGYLPPNFVQRAEGFVGFRLGSNTQARYGFLYLRTNTTFGIDFLIAAIETTPGEYIITYYPEPSSLAALALGAVAFTGRNATGTRPRRPA